MPWARTRARTSSFPGCSRRASRPTTGSRGTWTTYLYVALTNATAFSPTDTMPLSRWAKLLMSVQSTISLLTLALIISRAVGALQ